MNATTDEGLVPPVDACLDEPAAAATVGNNAAVSPWESDATRPLEQAVIGALLIGGRWPDVAPLVRGNDYAADHRLIVAAFAELAANGTPLDIVTTSQQLERTGHLRAAGGLDYLSQLARDTPTVANLVTYARAVRERAIKRRLPAGHRDPDSIEQLRCTLAELDALAPSSTPGLELRPFTAAEILAPIAPEQFLLPGVPTEAYTLIAGGLSSYKTTLLIYLLVWKATGWDLLGLDEHGNGCDIGRCVLLTYEDTDARTFAKLQRVIQFGHRHICERHSRQDADEFVERAAANIRRLPLAGKIDRGIVRRVAGVIVRNTEFVDRLLEQTQEFAPDGAMIGLDPLRLAISGSQSDDDGADTVVHTLNAMGASPGSGVIACSHTTKAAAQEPATGYAGAAYATSGSALYSQHARSNFLMARLKETDARALFDPAQVTAHEVEKQLIVRLTHGRLSHGAEQGDVYLVMREGTLQRIAPKADSSVVEVMRAAAVPVIAAIDRIRDSGLRVSADALANDSALTKTLGGRNKVRNGVTLLQQNGYLEFAGTTRDRDILVTDKGRSFLATATGENRRESQKGLDS